MLSRHTITVSAIILLLCAAIVADFATGQEVSMTALYAVPVAYAAATLGLRSGVIVALLASACGTILSMHAAMYSARPGLLAWNAIMRTATMLIVAWGFGGWSKRPSWRVKPSGEGD